MEDKQKTLLDKWVSNLKNNKLIAVGMIVFIVSGSLWQWGNNFFEFIANFNSPGEVEIVKENSDSIYSESDVRNNLIKETNVNKNEETLSEKKDSNENETNVSTIQGRLVDERGNGISDGIIILDSKIETRTDSRGYFTLSFVTRKNQVKVKVLYTKENFGTKERYVGVDQRNIILKL